MNTGTLIQIRRTTFLAIGAACVAFATLVISAYQDWADFAWWPGIVGVTGAIVIFIAASISGKTNAGRVWDELSRHEWAKAIRFGYWFALSMYPLFGLLVWGGIVDFRQAFASMG
ncbi:MAG: hypothetical protein ACPGGK_12855, partial [Pikeienuella sp.]